MSSRMIRDSKSRVLDAVAAALLVGAGWISFPGGWRRALMAVGVMFASAIIRTIHEEHLAALNGWGKP
jgi:hypothetical protein